MTTRNETARPAPGTPEPIYAEVAEALGHYVYLLVDPRKGKPFYVGKGVGNRSNAHELEVLADQAVTPADPEGQEPDEAVTSRKKKKIKKIHKAGLAPEVWIARYGLTKSEYTAVEAALIDVLSSFKVSGKGKTKPMGITKQLTNERREASRGHGIERLSTLINDLKAPELTSTEPMVLITLSNWADNPEKIPGGERAGYGFKDEWINRPDLHLDELADSTRAWWVMNPESVKSRGVTHAVAVYRGVTRGLFRIESGSWRKKGKRHGFQCEPVTSGKLWEEVVGEYGHRVPGPNHRQNSVYYWPRT